MTGHRPRRWLPLVAAGSAATLALGTLGLTASANAKPKPAPPAPAAATERVPTAPAGSIVRIRLSQSFLSSVRASGGQLVGTGSAVVRGARVQIPIAKNYRDGYQLAGGLAIQRRGTTAFNCPEISVWTSGNRAFCGKGGTARETFIVGNAASTTSDDWTTSSGIRIRIVNDKRADEMGARLKGDPFDGRDLVGTMTVVTRQLLRSEPPDDRTGCWMGDTAGDNSIWRGWAIQAMVNRLPKDVGMSQYSVTTDETGTPVRGVLTGPQAPAVTVGQRTPYLEKVQTKDSKRIIRGAYYDTDHWWDGPRYGCNTNAPYVVGQGLLDDKDVRTWTYDGDLRTKASASARPQWWGHPRQTNYDGPTGFYTWVCRGLPTGKSDTHWKRVDQGTGFFGDTTGDRSDPDAGRAPACRDLNIDGMKLTTRYSISKRAGLESRDDQSDYPRYCTVADNPLVSCWQEIYPLWDRAWAFQYHVYASALRANITSVTQLRIPADYGGNGTSRPITWRITDGEIPGAWPRYRDDRGNVVDLSGIESSYAGQDWSKPSPFTVPGTGEQFTVAGYGRPMGPQEMSFILTADSDGTWDWPVHPRTGRELVRPQIKVTFGYVISNYDDGGTCKNKTWYDDDGMQGGRNNDSAGGHCLQGNVPTIWPLPEAKGNNWKRVPDVYITDKDGKRTLNRPTVSFDYTNLASCLQAKELVVQDNSSKTAPNVGADFTWNIRLAGTVTSFSGC